MTIKALIFDADGMVIHMAEMFSQRLIKEHPKSKISIQDFFNHQFQACVRGRADLKTELKPLLPQWDINLTTDAFLQTWFMSENKPNLELISLMPKIQQLHLSCYLATNQEKYRLAYLADDMGYLNLFDHLFVSCEIGAKKPEPKFLNYVWNSLQYLDNIGDKQEVMFWDDHPEYVSAARTFGFTACHFQSNAQFKHVLQQSGITL